MEIRIGIVNGPRELVFESAQTPDEVEQLVEASLSGTVLKLADAAGKTFVIPSAGLAYVEIGSEKRGRVGFVA